MQLIGNAGNDSLIGTGLGDTLISGSGVDTLEGGTGTTYVINNRADVIVAQPGSSGGVVDASVSYTLAANINSLQLTAANITGTANSGNDTLIANGTGDTLVGGNTTASNDLFIVSSATDVISVGTTHGSDTVQSAFTYSLASAANVNTLVLTAANIKGTANSGNDTLIANGSGDTLVGGTTTASNDLFVISSATDVISVGTTHGTDTIQSSVSYSLASIANVNLLNLTAANCTGTANSGSDLLKAQSTGDTLIGGSGVDVLEGGLGNNVLMDTIKGGQAALIGGSGGSTLTGGAKNDFYAAGTGGATITTGATHNVIAINKGSGAVAINPTIGASNILSLGAGIDTLGLSFSKSGNNLLLSDGQGDTITFTNWYASTKNQTITTLQVVEQASASYNASGSNSLQNKPLEEFNFTSLVNAFNAALAANPSLTSWSLSAGMPAATIASSATAAYGGDLAYYYGLNGTLNGLNLSDADSTLQSTAFGSGLQTINTGVTGGAVVLARLATGGVDASHPITEPGDPAHQSAADGSGAPVSGTSGTSTDGTGSSSASSTPPTSTPGSLTHGVAPPVVTPPVFGQQTGTGTSGGTSSSSGGSSGQPSPGNPSDPSFNAWLQSLLNQSAGRKGAGGTPFTGTLNSGGGPAPALSLADLLGSPDGNGFVTSDALRSATGNDAWKQVDAGLFPEIDSLDRTSNASQWSLANDASAESQRTIRSAKAGSGAEEEIPEDVVGLDFLPSSIHHRMLQHKAPTSGQRSHP